VLQAGNLAGLRHRHNPNGSCAWPARDLTGQPFHVGVSVDPNVVGEAVRMQLDCPLGEGMVSANGAIRLHLTMRLHVRRASDLSLQFTQNAIVGHAILTAVATSTE
jgi:hypothetical protein